MTDAAVVLDLAAGRVYHFKHGWIPLDHVGRERLRAHGVNPDGHNVIHNGKVVANYRTKREAIAHADRLNGFTGTTSASVKPGGGLPESEIRRRARGPGPEKPRLQVRASTYRGETGHTISGTNTHGQRVKVFHPGNRTAAEGVKADIAAGRDPFDHGVPSASVRPAASTRPKVRTSARTLASRLPADGRSKAAPPRRTDGDLQARADAAVRMTPAELRAAATSGDKVARTELDRRGAEEVAALSTEHLRNWLRVYRNYVAEHGAERAAELTHMKARAFETELAKRKAKRPPRADATQRLQQTAQDRTRRLQNAQVAADERAGGVLRSGPGGQARLADPMAYERGNLGGNDPAEVAKLRTDAELREITTRMPNTAEGRAAKAEIARRDRDRMARGALLLPPMVRRKAER